MLLFNTAFSILVSGFCAVAVVDAADDTFKPDDDDDFVDKGVYVVRGGYGNTCHKRV